jgi:hypothetical protein
MSKQSSFMEIYSRWVNNSTDLSEGLKEIEGLELRRKILI